MRFFRFFQARRPLAAAVIGLLLGPAIVSAYLGRGRMAIAYLLVTNIVGFPVILAMPQLALVAAAALVAIPFNLIGCIHGYWLARGGRAAWQQRWFARWYNIALVFWLLPIAVAFFIRAFIVQPFSIPSGSMMPTLMPGNYAFVTKFNYGYGRYSFPFRPTWLPSKLFGPKPQRGDVVILAPPAAPNVDYAKRIIGLPGDRVQMKGGIVFINGQAVPRDAEGTVVLNYSLDRGEFPIFGEVLDNGVHYRTLDQSPNSRGDNTSEYSVPAGSYFVLGDNRDNSNDSRFDIGFVPEANIYGKFWLVFRSEEGWSFVH